jgi:hypothetical protein
MTVTAGFAAAGKLGHSFVLLGDFQHRGLGNRVAHETGASSRIFRLRLPIIALLVTDFFLHAQHRGYHSMGNDAGPRFVAPRTLPRYRPEAREGTHVQDLVLGDDRSRERWPLHC